MRPGRHAAAMDQEPLAVWLFVELAMSSERGQVHHPPLVCSVTTGLLHLRQTLFLCTSLLVVGGWLPSCNPTPPPRPFDGAEWSFCHCRNTFESRAGGCLPRRRRQLYSPEPLSSLSTHILRMPFADNPVMCSYIIASVRCSRRGLLRNTCTLATPRFLPICRSFL